MDTATGELKKSIHIYFLLIFMYDLFSVLCTYVGDRSFKGQDDNQTERAIGNIYFMFQIVFFLLVWFFSFFFFSLRHFF